MDAGTIITGMIYIMELKRGTVPTREYYQCILNAYFELGLRSEIKEVLDPALTRSIRKAKRTSSR